MTKPIIDLEELLEEAKDRIEEKIAIEGGDNDAQQYCIYRYRFVGIL